MPSVTYLMLRSARRARLEARTTANLGRGCDREAADHLVALDQAGDKPGFLRLLDEVAQEGGAGGVALRSADRLLHGGELAVENSGAGQLLEIAEEAGPQAGQRVHLVVDELLKGDSAAPFGSDHLGMLDVAGEPKVVGAARR